MIVIGILFSQMALAQPAAEFVLRLGPSEADAVLTLGDAADDTLELEVWVEVTDPPAAGTMMTSIAFFLNANTTNVIMYNGDFTPDPAFSTWSPLNSGLDNQPDTGDFDRAFFTFLAPTSEGIDSPTRFGTFTVTALDVGSVGFAFDVAAPQRAWSVGIDSPEILQGPQVTGSVDSSAAVIRVVSAPLIQSADSDGDCDVDLYDYRSMQICVPPDGQPISTNGCQLLDLNADGAFNGEDVGLLVGQLTGAMPLPGDLDADGDIDIVDYGMFQVCLLDSNTVGFEIVCQYADVNRDGAVDASDYPKFNTRLNGPGG
ncbi:MAG: hypothetical protein GXP29_02665 [Planctomycetes bacterium]|nr:hypothetical protein [Planctomycetota bacterium]